VKLYDMHPTPVNTAFGSHSGDPNAPDPSMSALECIVGNTDDVIELRTSGALFKK